MDDEATEIWEGTTANTDGVYHPTVPEEDELYHMTVTWRYVGGESRVFRTLTYEKRLLEEMSIEDLLGLLQVARDYWKAWRGTSTRCYMTLQGVDVHVNDRLIHLLKEMIRKRLEHQVKVDAAHASLVQRVEASLADGEGSERRVRELSHNQGAPASRRERAADGGMSLLGGPPLPWTHG